MRFGSSGSDLAPPLVDAAAYFGILQGWAPSFARSVDGDHADIAVNSTVEETALAVEALIPAAQQSGRVAAGLGAGLEWLVDAVETGQYLEPSPIGFYFAKLWYYERLYPQLFATRALACACRAVDAIPESVGVVG